VHRYRFHCLVVARRCGQTDDREMGAAAWPDFIAGPGKPSSHATEPACRSSGRGKGGTSATGASGAFGPDGPGRRRTNLRHPVSWAGAVATVDGE
jgi:hypothetical protein